MYLKFIKHGVLRQILDKLVKVISFFMIDERKNETNWIFRLESRNVEIAIHVRS